MARATPRRRCWTPCSSSSPTGRPTGRPSSVRAGLRRRSRTCRRGRTADAQGDPRPPARLPRHCRPVGRRAARNLNHRQNQRLRIPLLEEKPFELKADMATAQAVTPGQGQTVRVAGVRVGDISAVDYEDGRAVVTMDIDRKFLPVYRNATILLRPKTGLKDMFLELDPGTDYQPSSREDEFENGDTIPLANTAPDTNVDEVLAALDVDTRAYLRLLLTQGGQGLNDRGQDLGKLLGSLGPINRGLARLNTEVAKRKENLRTLIHNMNLLFGTVGEDGEGIRQLVSASNQALGAIGSQSPDVQRTVALLGPTLRTTRVALEKTEQLATVLGPTINSLRPFARKLKPIND